MMLYQYRCYNCAVVYDILQGANYKHEYVCPVCEAKCTRLWNTFLHKKNEGFYSDTLGRWVDSHTDFERGLREARYMTQMDWAEKLGDNSKPEDQWVEQKAQNLEHERQESQQKIDMMREYNAKIEEGKVRPSNNR
jgi:predicted nucleic acid-binding Zn ribbon protein